MIKFARLATVSLMLGAACSNNNSTPVSPGTGGHSASGSGGTGGPATGSGGNTSSSGGATVGSGGTGNGSGGNGNGSGGSGNGSGGSGNGSGGNANSNGSGGASGSGGGSSATGGASSGSGGAIPSGGSAMGGSGTGGGGGATVACAAPSTATGTAATVTVDVSATPLATVGPDFMGIHTSVYDGSMANDTTPPLLKAAGVTSLRYPGGSYGDIYHWEANAGTTTRSDNGQNGTVTISPKTDFGSFVLLLQKIGANAMITVNYGTNPKGTGPGLPQEAEAWVAYANAMPSSTTSIGVDSTGYDWKTVGYWAGLRGAAPLATDDGFNFLRIGHPEPVGIKYWEIGNELYGNGYYYGRCGWEPDLHVAFPAVGTACTNRQNNAALSPATYGMGVKAFATAMKAADPNVKVGAIVHWPYNEYADWNGAVLPQACSSIDFVVNHWYAGTTLNSLLTIGHTAIPMMYKDLRTALTTSANGCGTKGATLPIGLTEWGPLTDGTQAPEIAAALTPASPGVPTHTQFPGIFAAETYANLMEQGALTADWLELHSGTYLTGNDTPAWGYHGALIATRFAGVGDTLLPATVSNGGALMTALLPHASKHADGSVSVMLTNTSGTTTGAVTVNVTGGTSLACVGTRYSYVPVSTYEDGPVAGDPIFASTTGGSVSVTVPPYSVVVVVFPKR